MVGDVTIEYPGDSDCKTIVIGCSNRCDIPFNVYGRRVAALRIRAYIQIGNEIVHIVVAFKRPVIFIGNSGKFLFTRVPGHSTALCDGHSHVFDFSVGYSGSGAVHI